MTPSLAAIPAATPQLSAEHFAQLQQAGHSMRKLRRAVTTAKFDGWTVGAFGALTAIFSLSDFPSFALGVVMIGVAVVELGAAKRLSQLDFAATRTLGWNQLALGASLMVYALIRLFAVNSGESQYAAVIAQEPQLAEMLGSVDALTRQIMIAVYACLIVIALFVQGGMALYYFTRGPRLRETLATTPAWILDMKRAGVAV